MKRLLVNIDVPDLEVAIRFYSDGLGFDIQRTLFGKSVAELTLDAAVIYLIERGEGSQPIPALDIARTYQRHWTPVHLDVTVADIDAAVSRALEAGAVRSGEQTNNTWGVLAPLVDPFGHGICLIEWSDVGYDAVAD